MGDNGQIRLVSLKLALHSHCAASVLLLFLQPVSNNGFIVVSMYMPDIARQRPELLPRIATV